MKPTVPSTVVADNCYEKKNPSPHNTETLVNRACSFAFHILWPKGPIVPSAIDACKDFVRSYFNLQGNDKTAFVSFCERILLAHEYYEQYPDLLPVASSWLQADNDEGFAITLPWYHGLLFKRTHIPQFRRDLKVIISLYLKYTHHPCAKNAKNALQALARIGRQDLYTLFE